MQRADIAATCSDAGGGPLNFTEQSSPLSLKVYSHGGFSGARRRTRKVEFRRSGAHAGWHAQGVFMRLEVEDEGAYEYCLPRRRYRGEEEREEKRRSAEGYTVRKWVNT